MTGPVKILIVEDDAMIAMELEERLGDMGYRVIGPVADIAAAQAAMKEEWPDVALLDASLAGVSSVPLGTELVKGGAKVAFCTGYDQVKNLTPELADAPVLTKPVSDADLKAALARLIGR